MMAIVFTNKVESDGKQNPVDQSQNHVIILNSSTSYSGVNANVFNKDYVGYAPKGNVGYDYVLMYYDPATLDMLRNLYPDIYK